jgi:hypothetical protein
MNTKPLLYLSCLLATTLAAPIVNAGPHRSGGNHFAGVGARTGGGGVRPFVGGNRFAGAWNGARWNGQHWNGGRWNNWSGNHWNNWNWRHHHDHDDFFFSSFGFPFWGLWGVPWWYGSYYPYGYPYGYYGGGGYYGNGYNGNGYNGNGYNYGYGYNNGYSNGYGNDSNVRDLQRKLADAGYYHGPIDGIMGSRTEHALRAYRYDQRNGNLGGSSPTLRSRPYSPPPVTTEPEEPTE